MSKIYLIIIISFLLCPVVWAQEDMGDRYDENTEITIKGYIEEIVTPMRGPVVLRIKTSKDDKIYNLITAPPWFLAKKNISFNTGDYLEITGSKLINNKGELFIIMRRCNIKGSNVLIFRDQQMRPIWRGGPNQ